MSTTRKMGFDDKTVTGGFSDRPKGFSGERDTTYVLRIISDPVSFYAARVETFNKQGQKVTFTTPSLADHEDCEKAINNDRDALARCIAACPLWAGGYKIHRRFACTILLTKSISPGGREQQINQFLPWGFAGERYETLRNVLFSNPVISKPGHPLDGKNLPLHLIQLRCTIKDKDFQKMDIMPLVQASQQTQKWSDAWEMVKDFFADTDLNTGRDSVCGILEEFVAPDNFQELTRSIERAKGGFVQAGSQDGIGGDPVGQNHQPQPSAAQAPVQNQPRPGAAAGPAPRAAAAVQVPTRATAPAATRPVANAAAPSANTGKATAPPARTTQTTSPSNPAPSPEAQAGGDIDDLLAGVDAVDLDLGV